MGKAEIRSTFIKYQTQHLCGAVDALPQAWVAKLEAIVGTAEGLEGAGVR